MGISRAAKKFVVYLPTIVFLKCQFLLNNFVEQQSCFVALVVVFEVIGLQLRFKALNAALNLIRYAHIK